MMVFFRVVRCPSVSLYYRFGNIQKMKDLGPKKVVFVRNVLQKHLYGQNQVTDASTKSGNVQILCFWEKVQRQMLHSPNIYEYFQTVSQN